MGRFVFIFLFVLFMQGFIPLLHVNANSLGCPSSAWSLHDDHCYAVRDHSDELYSFSDANSSCGSLVHSHLIDMYNITSQEYAINVLLANSEWHSCMWTGLHSAGDKWLWSSGMEADGDIWMDTDIAPSVSTGDCAALCVRYDLPGYEKVDCSMLIPSICSRRVIELNQLSPVTWFGCIVTAITCSLTALTMIGHRLMSDTRAYIRMCFLIMLGSAEAVFLAGSRLADIPAVCSMVAVWMHFSCLGSFTWLLSYVILAGSDLRDKSAQQSFTVGHFNCLGWMVPAFTVIVSLVWRYQDYRDDTYCWLTSHHQMPWAFLAPAIFLMALTSVVLIWTVYEFFQKADRKSATMILVAGGDIRACCILLPILGSTWIIGTYTVRDRTMILQIAFCVTNCLLGVVVLLFLCVYNEEVRLARSTSKKINIIPKKMEANIVTTFKEEGNRMVKGIESGVNLVNKVKIPKGGKTVGVVEKQNKSEERVIIESDINEEDEDDYEDNEGYDSSDV